VGCREHGVVGEVEEPWDAAPRSVATGSQPTAPMRWCAKLPRCAQATRCPLSHPRRSERRSLLPLVGERKKARAGPRRQPLFHRHGQHRRDALAYIQRAKACRQVPSPPRCASSAPTTAVLRRFLASPGIAEGQTRLPNHIRDFCTVRRLQSHLGYWTKENLCY
jgi:hypothetical protein